MPDNKLYQNLPQLQEKQKTEEAQRILTKKVRFDTPVTMGLWDALTEEEREEILAEMRSNPNQF